MSAFNLRIHDKIAILEFDQPDSKVNVLNTSSMMELAELVDQLSAKPKIEIEALVITSKKDGIFIAGADIKEIENITTAEEAFEKAEKGKEVIKRLEDMGIVTVAVINGACLGGGFELALACEFRVASFSEKVKIGLPEVKLGVIPGFGGTVRLPRLVGLVRALGMILPGEILSGKTAFKYGLVDILFPEVRLNENAIDFARAVLNGAYKKKKRKKKLSEKILEDTPFGRSVLFHKARKNVLKTAKNFYPAPLKAIELISRTYARSASKAFRLESKIFSQLAVTEVSKNLIKVFYLLEEFKKFSWVGAEIKPRHIKKCAVVGAGLMGGGIAQLLAFSRFPSRLKDINYEALRSALKTAYGLFEYALKRRKIKICEFKYKFGLVSPTLTYRGFENTDLVIEAVVEDLKIKQNVFKEIDAATAPDTIFVSNTSSLPIIKLAEATSRPQNVAGLHFFNPVHRMPLVEVIRSEKTSSETLATVIDFARKLGKLVIVVKDVPGFLINRILLSYLNEAGFLAGEGMDIGRIDRLARNFGMPLGPVELIDEVGIDVGYKVAKILEESYGERMRVCGVLEKAKSKGLLGKKAKAGFYVYKGKKKSPNPAISDLIGEAGHKTISNETALKRMIYIMVNEAARCLEEHVVERPHELDIGMITGTGFPPFRGGLLRYADSIGAAEIVKDLKIFEKEFKAVRFASCSYLLMKADKGEKFY